MTATQRVLAGTPVTLSWQPLDSDGANVTLVGPVTIGITLGDGTAYIAPGTTTVASGAMWTFQLAASQTTSLNVLTATWTDTATGSTATTTLEIVGGYYFTIGEARALPELPETTYANAQVIAARVSVEEDWERVTAMAFVPRYQRERLNGTGSSFLMLSKPFIRTVRSVQIFRRDGTSTAFTPTQLTAIRWDPDGGRELFTSDGSLFSAATGPENVVIEYEHGLDSLPAPLKIWALRHMRAKLQLLGLTSGIPDRAERWSSNGDWMKLAMPALDRTGIPELDAELARYSQRIPGIA